MEHLANVGNGHVRSGHLAAVLELRHRERGRGAVREILCDGEVREILCDGEFETPLGPNLAASP